MNNPTTPTTTPAVTAAEQAEPKLCTMCSDPIKGAPLAELSIVFANGVAETQTVDTETCLDSVFDQWRDYVRAPGVTQL